MLNYLMFPIVSVTISRSHSTGVSNKEIDKKARTWFYSGSSSSLTGIAKLNVKINYKLLFYLPGPIFSIWLQNVSMIHILQELFLNMNIIYKC